MEASYTYIVLLVMVTVAVVCGQDPAPSSGVCNLPKVQGNCRASMARYYFDTRTGCCKRFRYGGCGSNGNNFNTKHECREACPETNCIRKRGGRRGDGGKRREDRKNRNRDRQL